MKAKTKKNPVSKTLARLIEEVFAFFGEKKLKLAKKYPEACIASILMETKDSLPHVWKTLRDTMEYGTFSDAVQTARQLLDQEEKSE